MNCEIPFTFSRASYCGICLLSRLIVSINTDLFLLSVRIPWCQVQRTPPFQPGQPCRRKERCAGSEGQGEQVHDMAVRSTEYFTAKCPQKCTRPFQWNRFC